MSVQVSFRGPDDEVSAFTASLMMSPLVDTEGEPEMVTYADGEVAVSFTGRATEMAERLSSRIRDGSESDSGPVVPSAAE